MHSFFTCSKGLNCRLRQTIAKDCFHCRNVLNSTTNNSNEQKLPTSFVFLAGQFPPPCLFGVNSMKKSIDVEKFLSWHHEQSKWFFENSLVYDFKKELVEYCDSDVKLLKNGFLEYRRLMMEICSDIDPFQVACTAASACNFIYRQLFMPEDSVAIIPVTGYSGREETSFPASQWLKWVELVARKSSSNHTVRLYRSGNGSRSVIGKEQKLGQFKVDGLMLLEERGCSKLDITSAYVFEFFGCFFHGCPSCYPDRLEKNCKLNGITMGDLFTQTVVDRLNWFQVQINSRRIFTTSDGRRFRLLHLYYFWECEFNDLLNGENTKPPHRFSTKDAANTPFRGLDLFDDSNIDLLKIVVGSSKNYYPLQARDSFVGGRTENFKS